MSFSELAKLNQISKFITVSGRAVAMDTQQYYRTNEGELRRFIGVRHDVPDLSGQFEPKFDPNQKVVQPSPEPESRMRPSRQISEEEYDEYASAVPKLFDEDGDLELI